MSEFLPPLRNQGFPFPRLSYLMDAYLHQDYDIFYADDIEAFDGFRSEAADPDSGDVLILAELDGALARPEEEIFPIIDAICDYYIGDNAHAWLEKLRAHLVATMKTPPTANEQTPADRTEDDHDL